jgi:hypothetical protein
VLSNRIIAVRKCSVLSDNQWTTAVSWWRLVPGCWRNCFLSQHVDRGDCRRLWGCTGQIEHMRCLYRGEKSFTKGNWTNYSILIRLYEFNLLYRRQALWLCHLLAPSPTDRVGLPKFWNVFKWCFSYKYGVAWTDCICSPCFHFYNQYVISNNSGVCVGWGIALQSGRSQVRFAMVSSEFFADIFPPAAQRPCGRVSL